MSGRWMFSRYARRLQQVAGAMLLLIALPALAAPSVTLTWDPNSEPDLGGYNLYYGDASGSYTNSVNVGNTNLVTITGLVRGATYYFAVTAFNTAGLESDFSNEVSYSVPILTNLPPTISPVADVVLPEDSTAQIEFAVSDQENAAADLQLSFQTANQILLPPSGQTLTGSSTNRVLTLVPALDQFGTTLVTVTVSDGTNSTSTTFAVTVLPVNDPPRLSGPFGALASGISSGGTNSSGTLKENDLLPDVVVVEDGTSPLLGFQVADDETPAAQLNLTVESSNTNLVPVHRIIFSGAGTNRTLQITPAPDQFGTSLIRVQVSDGTNFTAGTFRFVVSPVNDPPTLDAIADVITRADVGSLEIVITGITSGPFEQDTLTFTLHSNNPEVLPHPTLRFEAGTGSGFLSLNPVPTAAGTAAVTVVVQDNGGTSNGGRDLESATFNVIVEAVADLALTRVQSASGLVGQTNTVTLEVTNRGPSKAEATRLLAILPAPLTVIELELSQGTATGTNNEWTWQIGSLEPGAAASITIAAVALTVGLFTNSAMVVSSGLDALGTNNVASWVFTIDGDTDNDGLLDSYELRVGLNPRNASDAGQDLDGDGLSTLAEMWAGTDPLDPTSNLKIKQVEILGDEIVVTFPTVAGKHYQLETTEAFPVGPWFVAAEASGTGEEMSMRFTIPQELKSLLYRIVVIP